MLLECLGVQIDKFYLPPFQVKSGDFVLINLFDGAHHRELSAAVADRLIGKIDNVNVKIHTPFTLAKQFEESKFRKHFYPVTVGQYLRKNANANSPFYQKIYEENHIYEKRKAHDLSSRDLLKLSVYSILSHNKPVIFTLAHIDPLGAIEIYNTVLEYVKKGGTAILLDWGPEFYNTNTTYVEIAKMNEDGNSYSPVLIWDKAAFLQRQNDKLKK